MCVYPRSTGNIRGPVALAQWPPTVPLRKLKYRYPDPTSHNPKSRMAQRRTDGVYSRSSATETILSKYFNKRESRSCMLQHRQRLPRNSPWPISRKLVCMACLHLLSLVHTRSVFSANGTFGSPHCHSMCDIANMEASHNTM